MRVIVSHKFGFVFIKTKKVAGTSIEIALSDVCGPQDVVTRISEDKDGARSTGPQNCRVPLRPASLVSAVLNLGWPSFYNHMPAVDVRRYVRQWDDYFIFTVERNPWDRAISKYFFRYRNAQSRPTFSEYVRCAGPNQLSNFSIYSDKGTIVVDRVMRYENLANEFADVWSELDLPGKPILPLAKSGVRGELMMSREDADHIGRVCSREIELFGYEVPTDLLAS